jgi:hypothetical protein
MAMSQLRHWTEARDEAQHMDGSHARIGCSRAGRFEDDEVRFRVVKCKPVAGKGDQGCGLVWRLRDSDDDYVTRANALEDTVHPYRVVKGRRIRFEGWDGKVTSGVWHELAMEMAGDHIQVFFDGNKVIDAHDDAFKEAGKFGVWTKADSIVEFDDLTATPR